MIFSNHLFSLLEKYSNGIRTPQPLSSKTNTQSFSQTGQMIELCCEYSSVNTAQSFDQYSSVRCTVQISTHNQAQSFDQIG